MKVLTPTTLDEATAMLAAEAGAAGAAGGGRITPIAGGTDLLVHWPEMLDRHEATYLDLGGVESLRKHRWTDDALVLGALATYWDVLQDPRAAEELRLLCDAARTVGAVQIQTRGTWAGNIANASPAADGVPVLMAYDAVVELASVRGVREVSLDGFYRGYKKMDLAADELITAIRVPRRVYAAERFEKVGARRAQAITKVGVAVTNSTAGWRVVANSVAPTVCRCRTVEALLEDRTPLGGPDDLRAALAQDVAPIDDLRSTARYRRTVLARVLYDVFLDYCDWLRPPRR